MCIARDSKGIAYLILIQISLSSYADHKSKYYSVCKKNKNFTVWILDYYCSLSRIEKNRAIYLYISPKQLVNKDSDLQNIFEISSVSTRSDQKTAEFLVGALEEDSEIADFLLSMTKQLTSKS